MYHGSPSPWPLSSPRLRAGVCCHRASWQEVCVEYSGLSRGRQEERETEPISSSSASAPPEPPAIGQCHLYSGQPSPSAAMPHAVFSELEFTDKLGSVLDSFPSCLSPQTDTRINYQQGHERRLQPSPVT